MENILSTCFEASTVTIRTIATYSHVIPIILSLILSIFIFIKAKYHLFSKIFLAFITMFCLWLLGDLIIWTSERYNLIYAIWATLDYVEIVFYLLSLYFATVFVKKSDISTLWKIVFFILTIPPLWLTITKQSVLGFNQPVCEAFNNDFLGQYKLVLEIIIVTVIFIYMLIPFFKKLPWQQKKDNLVVLGSMFIFFSTFGITEYLSSVTGNYTSNLYSLLLLPVFIIAIIYSVFELDIFDIKTIGSHYLVIGLIIIMSGQLFLIKDTANMILSISAIIFAIGLNYILFTNLKKESTQRIHIEKLSAELQNSNTKLTNINDRLIEAIKNETRAKENETQQRIKFEELASRFENVNHIFAHDIKNVLAKNRDMFVEIIMGTFGETSEQLKNFLRRLSIDTTNLITSVTNILRSGDNMKADPKPFNIKEAVLDVVVSTKDKADERKIKIETNIDEKEDYIVNADRSLITQHVLKNLIENAVNYNVPNGTVTINLSKKNADTILLSIKDTGWGMTEEDKKSLFKAGGHGPDSIKRNVHTSGFGLFIASQTLNLHNGKVYGISEGRNKGSTFFVELPVKFSGIKTITTKDQKNQLPV